MGGGGGLGDCRHHSHHFWPTLMKRTQLSELSIPRFSTYMRKAFLGTAVVNIPIRTLVIRHDCSVTQDDHLTAGAWAAFDPRELN